MLWTSIATGKLPLKHGILGFTEPDPQTGGIRPITNLSRKTKAIHSQKKRGLITIYHLIGTIFTPTPSARGH